MKYTNGLTVLAALLFSLVSLAQGPPTALPLPAETGQPPMNGMPAPPAPPAEAPPLATPSLMPQPAQQAQPPVAPISSWLAYPRGTLCCGNLGKDGPIFSEVYGRTGVSIPFGTGAVNGQMTPGFILSTGARTLLFNPTADTAWVVDFGVSTVWYNTSTNDQYILFNSQRSFIVNGQQVRLAVPVQAVTPDGMNQTYFNLSGGQECYIWGNAFSPGNRCRVGWDVGGRYGSCRFDLVNDRHRTDTVGGFFLAAHSDLEVPCGCCTIQVGGRAEYGYVWSDVLTSRNNTDLQTLNLMINAGLRF